MWYSYIFISCDLLSIVLQAIGGGMAASATQNGDSTTSGTHIMVAGLAVQVASMSLFLSAFALTFSSGTQVPETDRYFWP